MSTFQEKVTRHSRGKRKKKKILKRQSIIGTRHSRDVGNIRPEVSQKEKHQYSILTYIYGIYMEFRKMVTIILKARQQKRHRCIEQSFGLSGRRRGWDDLRE